MKPFQIAVCPPRANIMGLWVNLLESGFKACWQRHENGNTTVTVYCTDEECTVLRAKLLNSIRLAEGGVQ